MSQRRRKNYGVKRPKSQISIATAIVGAVCIGIYLLFLCAMVLGAFFASKAMAGLGVIAAFVCIVSMIKSIEPFRDTSYDTANRVMGLVLPLLGFVLWTLTYFIGIIIG